MAEDKKPKIDLKARLGKKTVSSPTGAAVPPPVGIPKPTGVPIPPFGAPQKKVAKVDASDPYASISADVAPARNEPKAIKVEMTAEVVAAQKKGRARVVALAFITAVVGALLGYALGGSLERSARHKVALQGAQDLIKEIDKSNAEAERLAETMKNARQKLGDNKYPEKEISELGGILIPFSGSNLTSKGIGLFKSEVVTQLITYSSKSQEANDQKEKLANILTGTKKQIGEFLEQEAKPKVRWSVYFGSGAHGPWVVMQPLPTPFLVKEEKPEDDKKYEWPKSFKIKDGGKEYDLKRYTSGDPNKGGDPLIIPVDPTSQGTVCKSDVLVRLQRELRDMEVVLRGDKSDPTDEKEGLIDLGKALIEQLKGIGTPGS